MVNHYTIQMASKISGVGVHTIRAWEKRYKAIVPIRDEAGHRVYSKEDVEKLKLLSELCVLGYTISKIAGLSSEELREQLSDLGKNSAITSANNLKLIDENQDVNIEEMLIILRLALKSYKLDVISQELSKIKNLFNTREFIFKVIGPLMSDLGRAVYMGEFTIAQEHALSSIVRYQLGHILYRPNEASKNRPIYLVCGIEGDLHEFGILQAAILCQYYDLNVFYLGPNLPLDALVDTVKSLNVKGVIIGATAMMNVQSKKDVDSYIERLVKKIDKNIDVVIGGPVVIQPQVVSELKRFYHMKTLLELDQYIKDSV